MKFMPFEGIREKYPKAISKQVTPLAEDLNKKLKKLYRGEESCLSRYLSRVFTVIDPKEKTVLDLGCGCVDSPDSITSRLLGMDGYMRRQFEPWLLRALHEYGANCIGIDYGDLSAERFKGYSRDLTDLDSLKMLPDRSVDLACAFMLFDSPTSQLGLESRNYYRGQLFPASAEKTISLFQIIAIQLDRVLKPEGYFIFDSCCVDEDDYRNPFNRKKMLAEIVKPSELKYRARKKR